MTREELIALRDAIDITLALPDSVREMLVKMPRQSPQSRMATIAIRRRPRRE